MVGEAVRPRELGIEGQVEGGGEQPGVGDPEAVAAGLADLRGRQEVVGDGPEAEGPGEHQQDPGVQGEPLLVGLAEPGVLAPHAHPEHVGDRRQAQGQPGVVVVRVVGHGVVGVGQAGTERGGLGVDHREVREVLPREVEVGRLQRVADRAPQGRGVGVDGPVAAAVAAERVAEGQGPGEGVLQPCPGEAGHQQAQQQHPPGHHPALQVELHPSSSRPRASRARGSIYCTSGADGMPRARREDTDVRSGSRLAGDALGRWSVDTRTAPDAGDDPH